MASMNKVIDDIDGAREEPPVPTGEELSPLCPARPEHGPTVRRPRRGQTPEQRYCGDWWDCRNPGCTSAVLVPSPELIAWLDARRDPSKPKQPEVQHGRLWLDPIL